MLKLLAVLADEGWGFVSDDSQVLLVKPPYRGSKPVESSCIEIAVARYDFEVTDIEFEVWNDLVSYLRAGIVESRRGVQYETQAEGAAELVRNAPLDIVKRFLERTESELIPSANWDAAESILTELLRNPVVRHDADLLSCCATLLQQVATSRRHEQDRFNLEIGVDAGRFFPLAFDRYGDLVSNLTEMIREDEQLLLV